MTDIIVATSMKEQQNIMEYLKEELKNTYYTDSSVTIVQSGISKVDVMHSVKDGMNLAKRYQIVIVPISMSLDSLQGFSHTTNININRLIARLDKMKSEAIAFVNIHKAPSPLIRRQKEALATAAKHLFD